MVTLTDVEITGAAKGKKVEETVPLMGAATVEGAVTFNATP